MVIVAACVADLTERGWMVVKRDDGVAVRLLPMLRGSGPLGDCWS